MKARTKPGVGGDREDYVLEDLSGRYAPHEWAAKAIEAYRRHKADRIIAETNNGGAMVEATIRALDPRVSFKSVHASRGKVVRAGPIAALYEQRKCITSAIFRRSKIRCVPLPVTSTVAATAIRRIASTRPCGH